MVTLQEPCKQLDVKDIMSIIPHRYPFLLVDKIHEIDLEKGTIVGQKNVTYNEPFFQGHFPDSPIMPGVIILESLAQASGVLVYMKGTQEKIAVLLTIKNARFRNPVHPGDTLMLHGKGIYVSSKGGRMNTWATVDGKVVVEAEMAFALVDKSQI